MTSRQSEYKHIYANYTGKATKAEVYIIYHNSRPITVQVYTHQ